MLAQFKEHIESNYPELRTEPFLLACSGGIDSVVLAHLCADLKLSFSFAHVNFRLRGADSDQDQEFVRKLANSMNREFFTTHFDTVGYVNKNKVSIQMAARTLRYTWFAEILAQNRINWLMTAHHADDSLETFLINLSRGTGIQGLSGIPAKTDHIVRPLLPFSRKSIEAYAKQKKLEWREDATNSDTKYLRNKIRHEVVPVLQELHPTFDKNFKATQSLLSDTAAMLDQYGALLRKQLLEPTKTETIRIAVEPLSSLLPRQTHLHLLLKDYGFTAWDDIASLLDGQSGKEISSKTHRLVKDRTHLLLQPIQAQDAGPYRIAKGQSLLEHPIHLTFEVVSGRQDSDTNTLYVDEKTLKFPLTVRKWKKGDYFHPLRMNGRKKLSKYFKDEKMDTFAKENQWLLCSNDEIVWIIGRRGDHRFRVQKDSTQILKIRIAP